MMYELSSPVRLAETYGGLLSREYGRGLSYNCLGFHGTSLETLQYAIRNGRLPGAQAIVADPNVAIKRGDLYYYPLNGYHDPETTLQNAALHAAVVARDHRILENLGLDIGDPRFMSATANLDGNATARDYERALSEAGMNLTVHPAIIRDAKEAMGIVMGIDCSAMDWYEVLPGDPGEDDRRIRTQTGLPISFIHGIVPLGEREAEFLKEISR